MNEDEYKFAGLYDLRLKVSQNESLVHINEYLYSEIEDDTRKSGEKIFDYVDPRNRDRQIEMEQACTEHLKEIGGYLAPEFKQIEFSAGNFEYEASVIIPVRNRIRTIRDAIHSNAMTWVLAVAGTWVCIIPNVVSSLYNWTVTTCTAMKIH